MLRGYRHKVTLQQVSASALGGGVSMRTWADVATVWADVRPVSGSEYLENLQGRSSITHTVRIRMPVHNSSGTAVRPSGTMRFVHETTRHLYVEHVQEQGERGRYYVCQCSEQVT